MAYITPDHWFARARQFQALHVQHGLRHERFLAYDAELELQLPLKISGGPDEYQLTATGTAPLYDVLVCRPTPQGLRVGWLDHLPAAKGNAARAKAGEGSSGDAKKKDQPSEPKEPNPGRTVTLSSPLKPGSAEHAAQTTGRLQERLLAAGLAADEAGLLMSLVAGPVFESKEMVVLMRLPNSVLDEHAPLEVLPEPRKTIRAALLLATNIDPGLSDEVARLVARLGDKKYAQRESAEKRLSELGSLALPALKEALESTDLEVVFRAERLLRRQNALPDQSQEAQPANAAVPGAN
jgi:hypothetical protein